MTPYSKYARRLRRAARRELAELLIRQNHKCHWCECPIQQGVNATIDHVWPISDGGGNRANIVAACGGCNSRRNRAHVTESRRIAELLAEKPKRSRLKRFKLIGNLDLRAMR